MTSDVVKAVTAIVPTTPDWEILSTGVEARILPVGAGLIDEVVASIPEPKIPLWHNPDKDRDEENPTDPAYLDALAAMERRKAVAATETLLMFGVELRELPSPETWLPRLRLLAKRGHLVLEDDLDDPMVLDLLYKKYIAVGVVDLIKIGQRAGLSSRDVEAAAKTFPGK